MTNSAIKTSCRFISVGLAVLSIIFAGSTPAQATTPDNPGPGLTPQLAISATLTVAAPAGAAASQFKVGFSAATSGDPTATGPWATPKFVANQTQCTVDCSRVTLDIIRNGVTTSYPLSWVSNSMDRSYLLMLEGNRTAGFEGALVGDVVRVNFAAGGFQLPDPSTGLVPFIRFDYITPSTGSNGIISGASSAATFGTPPAAPEAPSAVAGNARATVTIASGASPEGVTGYRLTANPSGNYCDVTLPATSCVVTGLTNGTSYTFTASAFNAVGSSSASGMSNQATPSAPTIPTGPSAPNSLANTGAELSNSIVFGLAAIAVGSVAVSIRRKKARSSGEPAKHRA